MSRRRLERVTELIQQEISKKIPLLKDPGLGFITIALAAEAVSYAFKHPDRMMKPLLWKFAACVGLAYAVALMERK